MFTKAIRLMILSALAFALMNIFVKNLSEFNVYQVIFFRSIGTLACTIPFLIKHKIPMVGNKKYLLVLRALVGFTAMGLFFASIKFLPIGSAVSIRYISPIFAAIFAIFLLKEQVRFMQWICFGIAFLGVLLLKGFDSQISSIGLILAILSAIFTGLVFIIIRKIGDSDHPVVVVNYFMFISFLLGGILASKNWITPVGWDWIILLSLGLFGYFGQLYMTKAIQMTEINKIAPLKYIEVIFTLIFGIICFNETYKMISVFAIFLILTGLYFNTILKSQNKTR